MNILGRIIVKISDKMYDLTLDPKLKKKLRYLKSMNVKVDKTADIRYADITTEGNNVIGAGTKITGHMQLGRYTTLSSYNHIMCPEIRIGRFTQFGPLASIYGMNHGTDYLSTYGNKMFLGNNELKENFTVKPSMIGNDVWIGHGAVVLPGVEVGDGAVIAAGAIVTKNVEPYSIVMGMPAVKKGMRFNEEIVNFLQEIKWWDLPENILKEHKNLFLFNFNKDIGYTLEKLQAFRETIKDKK